MHEPRDLTGNVKIASANADKGLGTGANDYGVAVDAYRAFGATTLFGGVGYTKLGTTRYIDVNAVANANAGASWKVGAGTVGAMYDYRRAASSVSDPRSELTGFYSFGTGHAGKMQLYATAGLANGSPDWVAASPTRTASDPHAGRGGGGEAPPGTRPGVARWRRRRRTTCRILGACLFHRSRPTPSRTRCAPPR